MPLSKSVGLSGAGERRACVREFGGVRLRVGAPGGSLSRMGTGLLLGLHQRTVGSFGLVVRCNAITERNDSKTRRIDPLPASQQGTGFTVTHIPLSPPCPCLTVPNFPTWYSHTMGTVSGGKYIRDCPSPFVAPLISGDE